MAVAENIPTPLAKASLTAGTFAKIPTVQCATDVLHETGSLPPHELEKLASGGNLFEEKQPSQSGCNHAMQQIAADFFLKPQDSTQNQETDKIDRFRTHLTNSDTQNLTPNMRFANAAYQDTLDYADRSPELRADLQQALTYSPGNTLSKPDAFSPHQEAALRRNLQASIPGTTIQNVGTHLAINSPTTNFMIQLTPGTLRIPMSGIADSTIGADAYKAQVDLTATTLTASAAAQNKNVTNIKIDSLEAQTDTQTFKEFKTTVFESATLKQEHIKDNIAEKEDHRKDEALEQNLDDQDTASSFTPTFAPSSN